MAKARKAFSRAGVYLILIIASVVSIFPCYFMFVSAFNSTREITNGKLLPGGHFIENLQNLLSGYPIAAGLLNSLKISLIVVVGSLLVSSLAAYGFEKFKTHASEKAYTIFLIGMMIPTSSLVIPLYRMMASAKLVDSHLAIILPAIGSIFLLFLFRQSFKSLPDEILESARIDGASELRIFLQIVLPSMRSTYAAAGIYAFMMSWNNYMWPMIVLQTETKKTITLMVSKTASSAYLADYGVQMMGLAIATLPMMVVFLVLQRSFVDGLTGSVKG